MTDPLLPARSNSSIRNI